MDKNWLDQHDVARVMLSAFTRTSDFEPRPSLFCPTVDAALQVEREAARARLPRLLAAPPAASKLLRAIPPARHQHPLQKPLQTPWSSESTRRIAHANTKSRWVTPIARAAAVDGRLQTA